MDSLDLGYLGVSWIYKFGELGLGGLPDLINTMSSYPKASRDHMNRIALEPRSARTLQISTMVWGPKTSQIL